MIRIVVADDHQLVREGIKKILAAQEDIELVGEVADLKSLLNILALQAVDVVLLDLSLGTDDELHALGTVREHHPSVPVLVISTYQESQFGVQSLRLGAAGYVCKSMTVDVIVKAIRKVHAGGRYISETLAELLAAELTTPAQCLPHEKLTDREAQVLRLLATGLPPKRIAAELSISLSSVNTYRARILSKMGMANTADLIRYAVKHEIAP